MDASDLSHLDTGSWIVFGVSVPGSSHLRAAIPCQDAHRHYVDRRTGSVLLAVADGAGSKERSAEGSALAVGIAIDTLKDFLGDRALLDQEPERQEMLRSAADEILRRFRSVAREVTQVSAAAGSRMDRPAGGPDALATTLTAAVLAPPWLGVISVGDGFVVLETDGCALHLLIPPGGQGMYANETEFLTSSASKLTVEWCWEPAMTAIALCTDGMSQPGLEYDPNHPAVPLRPHGYFAELFEFVGRNRGPMREVAAHLLSEEMESRTADDKTVLVAAWRDHR